MWKYFLLIVSLKILLKYAISVAVIDITACEGDSASITCETSTTIQIHSALYGRQDDTTCPHSAMSDVNCAASGVLEIVRTSCNTKSSCAVAASGSVFGDPCGGTYKYLTISYSCSVSQCPGGWVSAGSSCYWRENQKRTFEENAQFCINDKNAHACDYANAAELAELKSVLNNNHEYWTGYAIVPGKYNDGGGAGTFTSGVAFDASVRDDATNVPAVSSGTGLAVAVYSSGTYIVFKVKAATNDHRTCCKSQSVTCTVYALTNGSPSESVGSTVAPSTAVTYTCSTGFMYADGATSKTATCQDSGQFDVTDNTCVAMTCSIQIVAESSNDAGGAAVNYGTTVTYTCDTGFSFADKAANKNALCNGHNSWDNNLSNCIAITCSLQSVTGSTNNGGGSKASYHGIVTYTCNNGYEYSDGSTSKQAKCTAIDTWDSTIPNCQVIQCTVPTVNHGTHNASSTENYGTVVRHSCDNGYQFPDGNTTMDAECSGVNTWSISVPHCQVMTCTVPTLNHNTADSSGTVTFNTVATFTCNTGYEFSDHSTTKTTTCIGQEAWSHTVQNCSGITCNLPTIHNADTNTTSGSYPYGTVASYSCYHGYQFPDKSKQMTTSCDSHDTWSPPVNDCEVITCNVTEIGFSTWNVSSTTIRMGETVEYKCNDTYQFSVGIESKVTTCIDDNTWSKNMSDCWAIECSVPSVNSGAPNVSVAKVSRDTPVLYQCTQGFITNDGLTSYVTVCNATDSWTTVPKHCKEMRCDVPAMNSTTTNTTFSNVTYSTSIHIACHHGYQFPDGNLFLDSQCVGEQVWNPPVTNHCAIMTCNVSTPQHSSVNPTGDAVPVNTTLDVQCDAGYWFPDQNLTAQTTCVSQDRWNSNVTDCEDGEKLDPGRSGNFTSSFVFAGCTGSSAKTWGGGGYHRGTR